MWNIPDPSHPANESKLKEAGCSASPLTGSRVGDLFPQAHGLRHLVAAARALQLSVGPAGVHVSLDKCPHVCWSDSNN